MTSMTRLPLVGPVDCGETSQTGVPDVAILTRLVLPFRLLYFSQWMNTNQAAVTLKINTRHKTQIYYQYKLSS
jgi:hypothetical protein